MSAALLKDLYTVEYIESLATHINKFDKNFNKQIFIDNIFDNSWLNLELKQRMRHISSNIGIHLGGDYKQQIDILIDVYNFIQIKIGNRKNKQGLENIIFQDFVEVYGLEDFDTSMKALACFTINSTSEFAIRQFILKYETKTMQQMLLWSKSENEHLRRLASEGCRPRLPWAISLPKYKNDPLNVLEILEILQNDEVLYVKKSVANNLNDISKDNIQIAIDIAKKWYGQNEHKNWIVKHACRTLLKQGNQDVLKIFGFVPKLGMTINDFKCKSDVYFGDSLEFSFILNHKEILANLRIEYSIDFVRQNNKRNNKVFFISQKEFKTQDTFINKKHSFKLINTRKYYTGIHSLNIIVNGIIIHTHDFNLLGDK
jgi:3-methyladenine DNA glycosylase AlkC